MFSKLILLLTCVNFIWTFSNKLEPDSCLNRGQSIQSFNGCFQLIMQDDGNLVIYRLSKKEAIWASATDRTCSNRACMQGDGNFVVYDCQNKATWASGTNDHEGSSIYMQNDGNLVIYAWPSGRAIWASNTQTWC
ncbi:hypothetical protein PVAND_011090 [Polypedilum vanderplanki]|uniref:Bulb-type lectin domain-containing protein n=1 Tax=Polypedilum vanderplanki TaxID=319348 RepID=A0A9J6CI92_POLVA|nr:hypothetical protein PVAND_011090 [Polypedilum vanderplanki]